MGAFGEQVRIIGHGSSTLPVGRNLINDLDTVAFGRPASWLPPGHKWRSRAG